jgi:predicted ATP-binding protein involved in virulence
MSAQTRLRLDHLLLRNFRCFAECAIDLHPELIVLVAENGRGKTAILDAMRIAFGLFVDNVAGTRQSGGFERTDVRLVSGENSEMAAALPTEFVAEGHVSGQNLHWSRALKSYGPSPRSTTKDAKDLCNTAIQLRESLAATEDGGPPTLPLVAFYGTGRLWAEHGQLKGKRTFDKSTGIRLDGYADCLSLASSFKGLVNWFETRASEIRDSRFATENPKNLLLLAAVGEATQEVLEPTGWRGLHWDYEKMSLVVEHRDHGHLPLSVLSDGIRNTIALVADIARRCAILNPHLGAEVARQTPGVLLIDEVDMHLHPSWQQLVVDLFRKAFPTLQIIMSTHSPHVLSTVDRSAIRVISIASRGQGLVTTPTIQTRGVESADVLATIMKVDAEPPIEEAAWLRQYRALIEDGKAESPEALVFKKRLSTHFGETHPVMLDCERLIRFQNFKLKRNHPEGQ